MNLTSQDLKSLKLIFEEIGELNSGKVNYYYKIGKNQDFQISPKVIWGGFNSAIIVITIDEKKMVATSETNVLIKMLIGASMFMLFAFLYQSFKENLPFWAIPVIISIPFYFQYILNWQLKRTFRKFKTDLQTLNIIEHDFKEYN
jgi:hypothetical protein